MMKEIEVKILETSHKDLEPKILELGGKKVFDGILQAHFFDNGRTLRDQNQSLRLRQEGDAVIITHKRKEKHATVKIAHETECNVSTVEEGEKLLEALGYGVYHSYAKRRVKYRLGEVTLDFDNTEGKYAAVPEFLEIEAPSEELVFSSAKKLGIAREKCLTWSGSKVLEHYGIKYP